MGGEMNQYLTKEDLEDLLEYKLGPAVEVESVSEKPLTKPGENYGSNILAIEVVLKEDKKRLYLVAKLVPISPFLRNVFQCDITVRKEMNMYLLVKPEYEKIQRENNVPEDEFLDVIPVCYGARATKNEDIGQPADEGSAIILENLKYVGYELGDRTEGFDLAHTNYILKHLARFHATAVAIKIKKPEVFERTVRKACVPRRFENEIEGLDENEFKQSLLRLLEKTPGCSKYFNKVSTFIKENSLRPTDTKIALEPYASINHNDFWTNNMMISYKSSDERKIPTGFKIVDYQMTRYDSPAKDLVFFLYTSTEVGLLGKHYDDFVRFYHQSFVDWLSILNCDVSLFSLEKFKSEIELAGPSVFTQILFMLKPINLKQKNATELENFKEESFNSESLDNYDDTYPIKVKTLLDDFTLRSWL